jgi:hypothetical protein
VLKTLLGAKRRPHRERKDGPPRLAAVTGTPVRDLTVFTLHFGKLTLKAYTKGEHVLRFDAIAHNTSDLRTERMLDRFCQIITALAVMLERFLDVCDCVHASFAGDQALDRLPQPACLGATRLGGFDINRPRARAALAAGAGPGHLPGRVHRRRVHRQGPGHHRRPRLHRPARHLRHPQAARQEPHHRPRPVPALHHPA